MTLKNMINALRIPCTVRIRDLYNEPVCICGSDSKGIVPYLDLEVAEWFIYYLENEKNTICVLLDCDSILFDNETDNIYVCNKCGYFLHGYKEDGKLKFDNFCPNCGKKVENE